MQMRVGVAVLEPLDLGREAFHFGRVTVASGFAEGDPVTAQFWAALIAAVAALGFATARRCRVTRASFPRRLVGVTGGLAVFLEKIADVERESRVIDIEFDPSRNAG